MSIDEFTRAVTPTDDEVENFLAPLEPGLLEACADATTPAPRELARLVPRPRKRRWGAPLLMAAAALAVGLWVAQPTPSVVSTPAWTVTQAADIAVLQAQPPVIQVRSGKATFEVESGTDLTVHVGDVQVHVLGTVFSVEDTPDGVRVEVHEGRVGVRWPDGMASLAAGQVWTQPRTIRTLVGESARIVEQSVDEPQVVLRPPVVAKPEPVQHDNANRTVEATLDWARLYDRYDGGEMTDALIGDIEAWLALNPDHPVAEEAQVVRLELYAAARPPKMALAEMDAWLLANPRSPRRLEVLYRLAHVSRVRLDDCDRAIQAYQIIVREDADSELGELSRIWLNHCLDLE